jgi:hypothetical protein
MAILFAIYFAAPIAGCVAYQFGPRWALGIAAAAGLTAAMVALVHSAKHGRLNTRRA